MARSLKRADACRALFVCGLSSLSFVQVPPAAAYYNLETALALAPLLQLRAAVVEMDEALSSGQLREGYFQAAEGAEARARVKKLLKKYKPREQGIAAIKAARTANLLSEREANAARVHVLEAAERLAAVVEFDSWDNLDADYSSKFASLDTPEKRRFAHRAMVSAEEELDAAFACFGDAEQREAARFAGGVYSAKPVEQPGLLFPGMPGYISARDPQQVLPPPTSLTDDT